MNRLAIIPARSGSKGLKDKNILDFNKTPLMSKTIRAALESNCFDEVMVSTDSVRYSEIAIKYGAKVPFLRSLDYSNDTASSWDVVREVLQNYSKIGVEFDEVTLLQPTSPLRTSKDIINAYNLFIDMKADCVISVCECEHSPKWCNTLDESKSMFNFINKNICDKGRQHLDKYYRINGAIYIVKSNIIKNSNFIYNTKSYAYIMTKEHSIDIDSELDFKIAELIDSLEY